MRIEKDCEEGGGEGGENASRIWLPELVERFASFLHPNEVPFGLRLVNKATAAQFRGRREFTTMRLSEPVPAHAFSWRWGFPGAMRSLTVEQRRRLLALTAASGSIPNLEVALAHVGLLLGGWEASAILKAAAVAGMVELVDWLLSCLGFMPGEQDMAEAARAGQRAVCELLLSKPAGWSAFMLRAAARGGHPDLLDWLLLQRPEGAIGPQDSLQFLSTADLYELFVSGAVGFDLKMLQGLYSRIYGDGGGERVAGLSLPFGVAAGSPTPDWRAKVEWLEGVMGARPGRSLQEECCSYAAACPDAVDRLTWLRQRGYAVSGFAGVAAVRAGNLAALEFVLDQGVGQEQWIASEAAKTGSLQALAALRAHGRRPLNPRQVAQTAARHGHLPVVIWAVETLGFEVQGTDMLEHAASSRALSSVEVMAWLRQHGCAWSDAVLRRLAGCGCEEALEWAVAQGCPMPADGSPYEDPARNADMNTLACLRRLGCPWGPVGAVFSHCLFHRLALPILQWLVEEGCLVDWPAAVALAAERGQPEPGVWAWLEQQQHQQEQEQKQKQKQQEQPERQGRVERRQEQAQREWLVTF